MIMMNDANDNGDDYDDRDISGVNYCDNDDTCNDNEKILNCILLFLTGAS